jgi:hypothetical protein
MYDEAERQKMARLAIEHHIGVPDVDRRSRRLGSDPNGRLYVFPLHEWRVLWESGEDDRIVWSVKWLIAARKT